ncbi:hypothetical protein SO802_010344 [Lithocarpus litseifolius]|uniref:PB1-like domain-containing protein n=1 Tax=Lithocarpus litseifolius TaxID=425828 RepID=A0AAW2DE00_9ROSI
MQIVDLKLTVEINYGGKFVLNPNLEYIGGNIAYEDVDPNCLSFFEIQGLCEKYGAPRTSTYHYLVPRGNLEKGLRKITRDAEVLYMCEIHIAWPINKLVLYVEGGEQPLAVEVLVQNVDGMEGEVVEGGNVEYEDNGDVSDVNEEVNMDGVGNEVLETKQKDNLDFDWLEEGLEGLDFNDDDDTESLVGSNDDEPATGSIEKNEKEKISVYCKNKCGWRCDASKVSGELTFQIKTWIPECTCPRTLQNSQVTLAYFARKYMQDFSKNPNWTIEGVKHYVKDKLEVDISVSQVYRSKRKAIDLIIGDEQLQYGKLEDYTEMIRLNDVGSRVILPTKMENENSQPIFRRVYIRYNALKIGFLGGCRPIIGLDGCHLKGRFGGQILDAIARDGNDNIFPVALVVVEQANKDSWGLIPAIKVLFPTVEHRCCVKHIYNNFKVDHKGFELKDALWRCAGATTIKEFEKRMQELKDLDPKAWEYLVDINRAQWSKSHFTCKALSDYLANNLSESFNSMILKARDKPILAMLEWIRVRLMTNLYKKKKKERFMYEVDNDCERHVVNLTNGTCNYRIWDLTGLLCKHGITAIFKNLEKVEDYVHPCFLRETYLQTYQEIIQPMPGQSEWVQTGHAASVAPYVYKPPSRPPKLRKKAP